MSTKPKPSGKSNPRQQPGRQSEMHPAPEIQRPGYRGSGKLKGRVALITGGDSGIGRSIAVAFAAEGADVAIGYLSANEDADAQRTREMVEAHGQRCLFLRGDISRPRFCASIVAKTVKQLGGLDVLVNNAAVQFPKRSIADITPQQLLKTFSVNVFPLFYLISAALPHLKKSGKGAIVNTTSVTAYRGSSHLLDYSSAKGAIVSLTRSLANSLAKEGVRVNAVAPGPIWTPLIHATFEGAHVDTFGKDVPLGRPGQPSECAACYVLLASDDSSYMTGQVLHPNGGMIVNG